MFHTLRPVLAFAPAPALALVLGLLAGAAVGCAPERPAPNVLLITIDTLRADHLSPYGSTATHTPHAERLAAEGALFENAAAPMPTTRPSHATLFTGRLPREHGVTDNHLVLPEDELTLAEIFRDAGYRTGAFLGAGFLGRASGISQGFEEIGSSRGRPPADVVVDRATLDRARQLYAGEAHAVDAALGLLLLELDERKLAEETVTVLTADHGECFENGYFFTFRPGL